MSTLRPFFFASAAAAALAGCTTPTTAGCTPETDLQFCTRQSRDCDMVVAFDNCGTSRTVNCGMCDAPETCGGGGMANVCGAPPDASVGDAGPGDAGAPDAACPLCPTGDHWIDLRFTITDNMPVVNGTPYTHAFDTLVGVPVEVRLNYASTTETPDPGFPPTIPANLGIATSAITSATSDTPAALRPIAMDIDGRMASISLQSAGASTGVSFSVFGADGPDIYGFEVSCSTTALGRTSADVPISGSFSCPGAGIILRRYGGTTSNMTDYASGTVTFEYHQP